MFWFFSGSQIGAVFEQGQRAYCSKGTVVPVHEFQNRAKRNRINHLLAVVWGHDVGTWLI